MCSLSGASSGGNPQLCNPHLPQDIYIQEELGTLFSPSWRHQSLVPLDLFYVPLVTNILKILTYVLFQISISLKVINRPGVAGAVLQTPLSFVH